MFLSQKLTDMTVIEFQSHVREHFYLAFSFPKSGNFFFSIYLFLYLMYTQQRPANSIKSLQITTETRAISAK